jgi:hypothetical protein
METLTRVRIVLVLVLATPPFALLFMASADAASSVRDCGFLRASVPYSHHGHRDRWRTYVTGNASCSSAQGALNAVLHLNAKMHVRSNDADSYFSYHGWRCAFGNMGFQSCILPSHRPYRAKALAIDCATATGGCPRRIPAGYFG